MKQQLQIKSTAAIFDLVSDNDNMSFLVCI